MAHMPYVRPNTFKVLGLPEGVPLKKPSAYGVKACQEILKKEQLIEVVLTRYDDKVIL